VIRELAQSGNKLIFDVLRLHESDNQGREAVSEHGLRACDRHKTDKNVGIYNARSTKVDTSPASLPADEQIEYRRLRRHFRFPKW
jgi:hypothetical protein